MTSITEFSRHRGLLILALAVSLLATIGGARAEFITVASTTSTQNSGLFDHILPIFRRTTGIEVRVIAVGTGAAIRLARSGDADVLLVHHKPSEEAFVRARRGVKRHPLMYNDFILVGPSADPAGLRASSDAVDALTRIAQSGNNSGAIFLSRGDASGTHKREMELWELAGLDPTTSSGHWYRETGSGMGATLNVAAAMGAHALSDRGTWLSFANKADLTILHQGDRRLRNEYGVILVSREHHPHVKAELGQAFISWLLSAAGKDAIDGFTINGQRLFTAFR